MPCERSGSAGESVRAARGPRTGLVGEGCPGAGECECCNDFPQRLHYRCCAMDGDQNSEQSPARTLRFHYIKSNHFRTFQADGATGGVGPRADIQLSFSSERAPIPQSAVYELLPSGKPWV